MNSYKVSVTFEGIVCDENSLYNGGKVYTDKTFEIRAENNDAAQQLADKTIREILETENRKKDSNILFDRYSIPAITFLAAEREIYSGKPRTLEEIGGEHRQEYIAEIQSVLWEKFGEMRDGYAVLQTKDSTDYKFFDYSQLKKKPNVNDYDILWVENAAPDPSVPIYEKSDIIYAKFNRNDRPNHEKGYYGTSLSVSDVILLKENGSVRAEYVCAFGFKELDGSFMQDKDRLKEKSDLDR